MEHLENQNNTKEKSVSTHKTKIEQTEVENFLNSHYGTSVGNVEYISGGEGSQAFSFKINKEPLILRINKHYDRGFKKDQYAFTKFNSQDIPIPEILEIGKMEDEKCFAISKKVEGDLFNSLSEQESNVSLPSLFGVLDSIHSVGISETEGYGKWDSEGIADSKSWKEVLVKVDEFAIHMFENSILEKEIWDKVYERFIETIEFCPEEKYLVHGDYNFDNIFAKNGKIVGVIDWEGSMYGDFLYDIARLQFFSKGFDYEKAYVEFCKRTGKEIKNFEERLLCYKLYIGLSSLSFYAYSEQSDKYQHTKEKLLKLITE